MDKKVITVRSADRASGTPEDFTIIDFHKSFANNPKSVKAILICVPYSWYNVNESLGNTFAWTGDISGTNSVVLPANYYTGPTLATELETLLEAEAGGENYTVKYNGVTHKFTISSTESFSVDFTVLKNMHMILGFPEAVVDFAESHTSSNVADFVFDRKLWVCSDLIRGLDNGIIPWNSDDPPVEQSILAEIPISGCFNSILMFQPGPDMPFFPITDGSFSSANGTSPRKTRFFLKFPSGTEINLNGQEWNMQLVLEFN
jgi:hypothetical protein